MGQEGLKKREDISSKDKWKIEDLYENDKLWEEDFKRIQESCEDFVRFRNKLGTDSETLLNGLEEMFQINKRFEKVYVYANQKYHENTGNGTYQGMSGKAANLSVKLQETFSFVEPEILDIPEEKIEKFFKENKKLHLYRRYIWEKLRQKEHILSKEMESVLARVQEIAKGPEKIFSMFNNADIEFKNVVDAKGQETFLTHGRYVSFLESEDRVLRKSAFSHMYAAYEKQKNTLAAMMDANIKQESFYGKMRHYPSSLEAALDQGNIPLLVYQQLISGVNKKMESMYHYIKLRKETLGLEELHMYDLHVPMIDGVSKKYSFDEAKEIVKNGLKILGDEYISILEEGFQNSWIDVYENQGKRSGAYSWGAFGVHPFVLMNYNGSLNHVFTLAHEMGHAIHSYLSDKTQPYAYAGYRIFVAEVASTCNEALLIHYLIKHSTNNKEKAYLINYFLDQFKGTLFRQTMFAEFEQLIHNMADKGESVTAESLCKIYFHLNKTYYGDDVVVDQEIAMEWARIPHFYNPFYVYQYATGFSAAMAISKKILEKEEGIVEKYLTFLCGGSSKDPIDLLKICGVDMTTTKPVEDALSIFDDYLIQLTKLL